MALTFTDTELVAPRGRTGMTIPREVTEALEDSAKRGIGKLHKGNEAAVTELRRLLNSSHVKRRFRVNTEVVKNGNGIVTGLKFSAQLKPETPVHEIENN